MRAEPSHSQPIISTQSMSYKSHYKAFKRAYLKTGIGPTKCTHLCRCGSASTIAQEEEISIQDVRIHGRWDFSVMVLSYLKKIPHQVLRALAGFKPGDLGGKEVGWSRDVKPNKELKELIYPFLNSYRVVSGSEDEDEGAEESEDEQDE